MYVHIYNVYVYIYIYIYIHICMDISGALFPASICLIKVSNENTKTGREICSKLTIKTV